MRYFEFYQTNIVENFTDIKACLIKSVKEEEKVVTIFSALCIVKDNFDLIKKELKEKLAGLCRIKSSRPRVFCGFRTYGLEVHVLSDDKDILISRILGLFEGLSLPAENNHVEHKKGKPC
jgi:hypothetical protein